MYSVLNGTQFQKYTTVQGDRWDTISTRAYGVPNKMGPIIESNPGVPLKPVLDGGIILQIPIIPPDPAADDLDKLPPWKRQTSTPSQDAAAAAVPKYTNPSSGSGSFDDSFD